MGLRRWIGRLRTGLGFARAAWRHRRAEPERAPRAPLPRGEERDYTVSELAAFDGSDREKPVLLAIKGQVYDVTRGRAYYGPGGPYEMFAGRECSRALALHSVEEKDCNGDLEGLSPGELRSLEDWVDTFEMKYPVLGSLLPDP